MEEVVSFGAEVRRRRGALDLTQAQLARLVGCAPDMIRKIEAGRRRPSRQVAELLAEQLGVPATERALFVGRARGVAAPPAAPEPLQAWQPPPAPATQLVGRAAEIEAVQCLLARDDVRLVTVAGVGGVGKTRLASALAGAVAQRFAGRVGWVPLAALADAALVLPTIAHGLGLRPLSGQSPATQLARALADAPALLVLDNMEHLLECGPALGSLLAACPALKLLVTSRAVLRLDGEHTYTLAPLDTAADAEAVALFVARARATRPDFVLTPANAPVVVALCARLDGLPLAIELAAARVRTLTPQTLLEQIEGGAVLALLTGGARGLPERQQSLRAVIAWSCALIGPDAQRLLRRLSVCAGGCTLDAAVALDGNQPGPYASEARARLATLDRLDALVGHSLLERLAGEGEPRYALLEVVRAFALDGLGADDQPARECHARYYLALAAQAAGGLTGGQQRVWLDRLDCERHNLRAAQDWLQSARWPAEALQLAEALGRFWSMRGEFDEGSARLRAALAHAPGDSAALVQWRGRALAWLAQLLYRQGDYAGVHANAAEALMLLERVEDEGGIAQVLNTLGLMALYQGHYEQAQAHLTRALGLYQRLDDARGVALLLNDLGELARHRGALDDASARYHEALALRRALDDRRGIAGTLNNLGVLAGMNGHYDEAQAFLEECLAIEHELGNQRLVAMTRINLGHVALGRGDHEGGLRLFQQALAPLVATGDLTSITSVLESLAAALACRDLPLQAARMWGAAGKLRKQLSTPLPQSLRAYHAQLLGDARTQCDAVAFDAALVAGTAPPLAQIVAEALTL